MWGHNAVAKLGGPPVIEAIHALYQMLESMGFAGEGKGWLTLALAVLAVIAFTLLIIGVSFLIVAVGV